MVDSFLDKNTVELTGNAQTGGQLIDQTGCQPLTDRLHDCAKKAGCSYLIPKHLFVKFELLQETWLPV